MAGRTASIAAVARSPAASKPSLAQRVCSSRETCSLDLSLASTAHCAPAQLLAGSLELRSACRRTTDPPPRLRTVFHALAPSLGTLHRTRPQLDMTDEAPAQAETKRIGACLVCGIETTKLCSKCLGVEHELFFCSPAHQKLVRSVFPPPCTSGVPS